MHPIPIQVTLLKCGGMSLGTALHHVAVDGTSAFHFFQTWSTISRDGDGAAVEPPCHDRTLLRARRPPSVHPDALSVFCPKMSFAEPSGPTASKVFVVSADQLASLKRASGSETTFCALTALVWQCTCVARRLPPAAEARVSFSANIRRSTRPPLPTRYFGNALVPVFAAGAAGDVASDALESVAGRIRRAISRVDDELVRSAVDYHELFGIDYRLQRGILPATELRMVSWLGMPLYDADFGWGRPWRARAPHEQRPGAGQWRPRPRVLGGCTYGGVRATALCKARRLAFSFLCVSCHQSKSKFGVGIFNCIHVLFLEQLQ